MSDVDPIEAAQAELARVCKNDFRLRVSMPARETDSDVIIGRGLSALVAMREERDALRSHRDGLYRVFGWLARDERKHLAMVDETIQADVDTVVSERAALRDLLTAADHDYEDLAAVKRALEAAGKLGPVVHPADRVAELASELAAARAEAEEAKRARDEALAQEVVEAAVALSTPGTLSIWEKIDRLREAVARLRAYRSDA